MTKKGVSKHSKRRLVVFGTMSIFVIVYFFYVVISYSVKLISLQNEEREINYRLALLEEEEEKLKTEIEMLQDPEYIARYARENYLYSKDGEYIIKIDKAEEKEELITEENDYTGLIVGGGVVGTFLLIYLLTNMKRKN